MTYNQRIKNFNRILSFGPMVRVTGPNRFIRLIRQRLEQQTELEEN